MRAIVGFPVVFRRGADAAPFKLTAFFILLYVVAPTFADPVDTYLKYLLSFQLVLCFALLAGTRRINFSPPFLLAPALLTVFGCASFAYSIFLKPGTTTWSSALIPLIVTAIPLLIADNAARTDSARMARYLIVLYSVAALGMVFWQAVQASLGGEDALTS
jgi:hypothetical protein